jgi:hypothetical protein
MPQCPHCQTPYDKGQRYCSICGSFLLHPEQGDTFCPLCGVRVSSKQEFCHECDAPLKGEAAAALKTPAPETPVSEPARPATPAPGGRMQPWVMGLIVGAGLVIIILLILLFSRGASTPPAPKAAAPAPTAAAPAPAAPVAPAPAPAAPAPPPASEAPSADLKEHLGDVLGLLREAQQNKDIVKYMSVYSMTFPELGQKRADTLASWDNYDYTNLVFNINKVQPLNPNNAIAWVTWYIDTRNRRTQELSSVTQVYQVRFAKEMGKWRIRSLQEAETE